MLNFKINYNSFILKESFFDNKSLIHGINHTYRVMFNSLLISKIMHKEKSGLLAFCGAFIHDMSRKDDGLCKKHGLWSCENKFDLFKERFISQDVKPSQFDEIKFAVKNHSENLEIPLSHPYYCTTAILKDADALDRFRISEDNLNPDFLRFDTSKSLIPFAKNFFLETDKIKFKDFYQIIDFGEKIYKSNNFSD